MLQFFEQYSSEFKDIIEITYSIWNKIPIHLHDNWHIYLAKLVVEIRPKSYNGFSLEKEDVVQQLSLFWVKFLRDWEVNKPKMHLRTYLLRRSIWSIRDWLLTYKTILIPIKLPEKGIIVSQPTNNHLFKLDLRFLLYGTNYYPLSTLSAYERYLIFLKFKEQRNIVDMSYIMQCDAKTLRNQLHQTISKLKKLGRNNN